MMNSRYFLLVFAALCVYPVLCQNRFRKFLLTAPGRFGSRSAVCITLSAAPANISISILDRKSEDILSAPLEKLVTDLYECFEVSVNSLPDEPIIAKLVVRVALNDEVLNAVRNVTLGPDVLLTFIATDKPVYGSNEVIKIRLFSISADFLPILDKGIKVWLENPQGVHITQWNQVKSHGGFIDVSYPLVGNPFSGVWTVKAKFRGKENSRSFLVQKQTEPTFQVELIAPNTAEENSKVNVSVCARYVFGKAVSGDVQLNVTVVCPFAYYCSETSTTDSASHHLDDTGCAILTVSVEAGKQSVWRTLLVKASVHEEGTGQVQYSELNVTIIPSTSLDSIVSEFKLSTRRIKHGLPFEGKVFLSVRRKPVPETDVTFCIVLEKERYCKVSRTDNGTVPFAILTRREPKLQLVEKILLEVSWTQNSSSEVKKSLYLQPWFSQTGNYLHIKTDLIERPIKCGSRIKVQVLHTIQSNPKLYIMIKSRGSILLFDTLESRADVQVSDFTYKASEGTVILGDNHPPEQLKSVSFSLQIMNAWSPSASLIIYTVLENGDVLADSTNLQVEECFTYDVLANWNQNVTLPGSEAELKISSGAHATCAVAVVDKKVKMLGERVPKLMEDVFRKLKETLQPSRRGNRSYDSCINQPVASSSPNSLSLMPEPSSIYADSMDAFEDSDLLVISDLPVAVKPCRQPVVMNPKLAENDLDVNEALSKFDIENDNANSIFDTYPESDDTNGISYPYPEVSMRSNFIDTWIFGLYDVKDTHLGIPVKVPDSLTEWTAHVNCLSPLGLSIARPATLHSFQPFFVDFPLPTVVKRHELLYIPISVFNYLDSSIPVMLYLEPSEQFHIKDELSRSVCVKKGRKSTEVFKVLAIKLGAANISVKAEIDPFNVEECGPPLNDYKIDYIMKMTVVHGEGRRLEEIRSALICGNETDRTNSLYDNFADWTIKMSSTDYVEQTVRAEARVSADVFGPSLLNVDKYINLPTGCGEQNMLTLAINVLLVKYLLAKHRGSEVEARDTAYVTRALRNLDSGYQQQLSFRHPDGSYSAFGPDSSNSSIWLTAFVVRYFTEAKLFVHLDEDDLNQSVQWLKKQQLENGCFPMLGDVYHWDAKRRQMASDSPKALTSYILISILKGNLLTSKSLVKNAVFCLQASDAEDVYTDLLSVFALTLANETRDATWRMKGLLQTAERSYQMLWWQADGSPTEASIEMTSYGVLTLLHLGGPHFLAAAADAVRWLLQFQNKNGGFLSSQDSILGLEALAAYSDVLPRNTGPLQVSLSYQGGSHLFQLNEDSQLVQQVVNIPEFLTNIRFEVYGSGCSLVQAVLGYNVRRGAQSKSLKVQLKVESASSVDETIRKVEVCAKTKASLASTGMAVVEVMLPTGYFPDRTSLYQVLTSQKGIMKWEEFEGYLNFYLDGLTHHKKCFMFLIKREVCVENPSFIMAKVYDYYNALHFSAVKHNIQQTCNTTDIWLQSGNTIEEIHSRKRRNIKTKTITAETGDDAFSNFMEIDQDLDVPSDDGNPVAIFALPPPPANESTHKCPQCFPGPPELFGKLYCSSKLAAQIRMRGPHLLDVLQDLSPGRNNSNVHRTIAYTIKQRCQCDIVESGNSTAFILVTPPRFFNLRTVQIIHLDDSFAIFPWNVTSHFEASYFNISYSCDEMLAITR